MKRKFLLPVCGFVLIITALAAGNIFAPPRPLSANDLLLSWLIFPGRFFVPEPNPPTGAANDLALNPELVRLHNRFRSFAQKKTPGEIRIFCLGGSTTQGWPFQHLLSYPDFLNLELKDVLPSRRIKVINAGILSSDSESDLPLFKELLRYQPDIILVYEGRNEPLDASLHQGWRANLLSINLWLLRRFILYRYLRYWICPAVPFDHAYETRAWAWKDWGHNWWERSSMMARGPLLKNLARMVTLARQSRCRVMLITQVGDPADPSENWLTPLNNSIKKLAVEQNAPVIDAAQAFDSYRRGLGTIFLHHIWHPDVGGYFLISQTALHALARNGKIAPAKDWRWGREKSEIGYLQELPFMPRSLAAAYDHLRDAYLSLKLPPATSAALARFCTTRSRALKHEGWAAMLRRD